MSNDWLALLPVSALAFVVGLGGQRGAARLAGVLALAAFLLYSFLGSGEIRYGVLGAQAAGVMLAPSFVPFVQRSPSRSRWLHLGLVLAVLQVVLTASLSGALFAEEFRPAAWRGALLLGGSTLASFAIVCGLAPFVERRLGWNTRALWADLSQPYGSPLVAQLQAQSPNVFDLSRSAAEIAVAAGAAVGADLPTIRAAAMHADVGRLERARNSGLAGAAQAPALELTPELECRIEFDHVKDSVAICRDHDLPESLATIVAEHHGTMVRRRALAAAAELRDVDVQDLSLVPYRYPGPKPSSRESAAVQAGWFLAENPGSAPHADLETAVGEGEWANSGLSEDECSRLLEAALQSSKAFSEVEVAASGDAT